MQTLSIRAATSCMLLGFLLVGCNKKESPQAAESPQPASQTSQPAPPPPAATPASTASEAAPVQSSTPPPPSSPATRAVNSGPSTQGEYPGLTMTVQELKRTANTVTLKLAMINDSKNEFGLGYNFGDGNGADFGSIAGIHLIDSTNKKKYFVVRDSDGACLCSRAIANIPPSSQSMVWAKFPAPPDDVQKVTIEIPHFAPLEDVPISK